MVSLRLKDLLGPATRVKKKKKNEVWKTQIDEAEILTKCQTLGPVLISLNIGQHLQVI